MWFFKTCMVQLVCNIDRRVRKALALGQVLLAANNLRVAHPVSVPSHQCMQNFLGLLLVCPRLIRRPDQSLLQV